MRTVFSVLLALACRAEELRIQPVFENTLLDRGALWLLVVGGHSAPEERVPSVRELAVRLRVTPLTVQKVYRMLIEHGVLVSRPGAGAFVAKHRPSGADRSGMASEVTPAGGGRTEASPISPLAAAVPAHARWSELTQ